MGSTERLVQAMKEANAPGDLIAAAQADLYHELRGPLPFPIRQLAADLRRAGLPELAARADAGEFDTDNSEAAAWLTAYRAGGTARTLVIQRRRTGPGSASGSAAG